MAMAEWIVVTENLVETTLISKFEIHRVGTLSTNRRVQWCDVIMRAQDVLIQPSDFAALAIYFAFRLTNSQQA